MTTADLLWMLASWLLLAYARLMLRVNPRYRGRRRMGSARHLAPVGRPDPDATQTIAYDPVVAEQLRDIVWGRDAT